jgi:predicted RNA-binding Zn-ribbon protein involved in translation (DUF1610 family)
MSEQIKGASHMVLIPCPFCGGDASFERLGNRRQSTIVSCNQCGCLLESNEEWNFGTAWNTRAAMQTPAEAESLDERMKAAGMIPLSELLKSNGAMEKWERHAGMKSFTDFVDWVHRKQREYMTMRMQYELGDKDKNDDLFQWVFAHAAVFNSVATQLRAIAGEDSQ